MAAFPGIRLRPALVAAHRWFGLAGALWLLVIAITGSILVFHDELDEALNRDLFTVSQGEPRPLDDSLAAALKGHPDYWISYTDLPNSPSDPLLVSLVRRADAPPLAQGTKPPLWQVYVDPQTASVLGARDVAHLDFSNRGIVREIYALHRRLMMGGIGEWIFGLVALLWLLDHLVSAVLAFDSVRKWVDAFRIRRRAQGHKLVFDFHRAAGLWLFPITLTLAVSGVYFNWYKDFIAVLGAVSPITKRYDELVPPLLKPNYAPIASYGEAAIAAARESGAKVDGVAWMSLKGLYRTQVFDKRDPSDYGQRSVYVDGADGKVKSDTNIVDGSFSDVFMAWQFPLHSGQAFGWPGRIAILMAGLGLSAFIVTGPMIWARKRAARQAMKKRERLFIGAEAQPVAAQPAE